MRKHHHKSFSIALYILLILSISLTVSETTLAQDGVATRSSLPAEPLLSHASPTAATPPAALPALPVLEVIGVSLDQSRPLSLREAIEMALQNNPDIEMARQTVRAAEFTLTGTRGAYDVRFSSSSFLERTKTPTTSVFTTGPAGSSSVTDTGIAGAARLEGLAPRFGGNYAVEFSSSRATTNNLFSSFRTFYPTALTLSLTQPILRNRRFDITRRRIEIARRNVALTDQQFRQRAINTIAAVQSSYWDVVFALRNLQVQQETLKDAREQLAHNRRQVANGVLAPIDVVSVEAQVARLESEVYTALDTVAQSQNALKNLIVPDENSPMWNEAILPTDDVDLSAPTIALPEAMAAALANRPELQQVETERAINDIDRRYFREQTKPQVDLVASYSLNGLAGSQISGTAVDPFTASLSNLQTRVSLLSQGAGLAPLPAPSVQTTPGVLVGGYGQSLSNLFLNRYNTARIGVTVGVPIRNRTAKAELGRAMVEGERIQTQRRQLVQAIQVDVRNALQAVRTTEARLRSAVATREASEKEYASERRKFNAGRTGSSLFLVLERQTQLVVARGAEVRAQTDLNKRLAELARAMGNTLRSNSVIVSAR